MTIAKTEQTRLWKTYPLEMVLYNLLSLKDHETIVLWNSATRHPAAENKWDEGKRASCLVPGQGDLERLSDKCSSGLLLRQAGLAVSQGC